MTAGEVKKESEHYRQSECMPTSAVKPQAETADIASTASQFSETLEGFDRILDHRLVNEAEIILQVLLKHGERAFG